MPDKKTVYVIGTNHFDPIWRRGFKKPFYYQGQKFVGNAAIEDACLTSWLKLCENSSVSFEVECSLVLRTYLENHPETLPVFQKLMLEGRFELLACGEVIPDTNMAGGETLVRNLVYGLLWAKETLGETPVTGNLNDAFGCSAQMPQIFKGCGIDWLTGLSYQFPNGEYWKGLDGTTVKITPNMQYPWLGMAKYLSEGTYYRPCPACAGEGCPDCEGRGFDQSFKMGAVPNDDGLDVEKNGFGVIYVGGEETLAKENLAQLVEEANHKQDRLHYRFGLHKEIGKAHFGAKIAAARNCPAEEIAPEVEGNPIQTGCYVSRIQTKQQVRRLENRALAVEKLAALAFGGSEGYPSAQLLEIWRKIAFCSFHDNITGTHVDVGYEELLETYAACGALLDQVECLSREALLEERADTVTVFNPHSFPCSQYFSVPADGGVKCFYAQNIPAGGFLTLSNKEALPATPEAHGVTTAENECYCVRFDSHGITGIFDKRFAKELIREDKGYANELILENDIGDPWTTREEDRKRTPLGRMNELVSVKQDASGTEIFYRGKLRGNEKLLDDPLDYRVLLLEWEQRVYLRAGESKLDFETKILWDAFDRRLRIAFPTYMTEDDGDYAIPYGAIRRAKYDKEARKGVGVADGDWPAAEWFATAKRDDVNVALINTGTPSSRIERGTMLLSILRSPTFPSCLFWPRVYYAPVYDGMRDRGNHRFSYSLTSFMGDWQDSGLVNLASAANMPMLAFAGKTPRHEGTALPKLVSSTTRLAAYKQAEDGDGMVARLFEHAGRPDCAELRLPAGYGSAWEANLLEEKSNELTVENGVIRVPMRSFEIKTIRFGGSL